jgi:hypothetical protein
MTVWNELCNRNSTKPDDLSAILAVFLGCSAGELLTLPRAERMHALLKTQSELPASLLFAPTNPDAEAWCPIFPTCGGPPNSLTDIMGSMKVTAEDYFEITELKSVVLFRCAKALSMHGTVRLHDLAKNRHLEIHFSDPSSVSANPKENVLLLLSSSTARDSDHDNGSGLSFTAVTDNERGVHARFFKPCIWRWAEPGADGRLNDDQTGSSAEDLTYAAENEECSTISIDQRCITHTCPLTLDMGSTWPKLNWSRPAFYLFIGTALNSARMLNLFSYFPLFTYALPLGFTIPFVIAGIVDKNTSLALCIAPIVCDIGMVWRRSLLARHEYSWLQQMMHQNLQRIWAASFKSSELEQGQMPLLYRSQYRLLIFAGVVQCVVLISSIMWIISLFKQALATATCSSIVQCVFLLSLQVLFCSGVSDPLWLNLVKPGIIATTGELFCRFVILVWFQPWRVPRNVDNLMRRGSVHGTEALSDLQYDLARFIMSVTVFGALLALGAFSISFCLSPAWQGLFDAGVVLWVQLLLSVVALFFTMMFVLVPTIAIRFCYTMIWKPRWAPPIVLTHSDQ